MYRPYQNTIWESDPGKQGPPGPPELYPSIYASATHIVHEGSVFSTKHVHAGHPTIPVQAVSHRKIVTRRDLPVPPPPGGRQQDSTNFRLTTNAKRNTEEANKATLILCHVTPPRSYLTQTYRSSHPTYSQTDRSDPPYRLAPKPPKRLKCSTRFPPPTPPHQRQSRVVKDIKITHDKQKVKTRHPDHPSTLTVMQYQWPVVEGETVTMDMLSRPKACPQYRP